MSGTGNHLAEPDPGGTIEFQELHLPQRMIVGRVGVHLPGSSVEGSRSRRLVACFMMFSRLKSSPHCLSTSSIVLLRS
jgi:hypothetical protein